MSDPASTVPVVDGDVLSSAEKTATLLALFDSLGHGEHIVLSDHAHPARILAMLRKERCGQFDWTPVGRDRTGYRVEISRRSSSRGALRRISDALGWDHDRLARLEVGAFVARAAGDTQTAPRFYEAFSSGLQRHISIEEEILFPLFEQRSGLDSHDGPTGVMRREHQEILRLLREILQAIGDPARLPDDARARFHQVLEEHHLKEEGMLYPALDGLLTAKENDELVGRIQTFRP
jgi:regulator of cell morphogenesis and NO signaling